MWWEGQSYSGLIVPSTTDPGQYWKDHPPDPRGVAVITPQQARGMYGIGKHQGKYDCLKQRKEAEYWRVPGNVALDDWDTIYELMLGGVDPIQSTLEVQITNEIIGSNLHRASLTRTSTVVGKWSAACQVIASPHHFDAIMALARGQVALGGGSSYTYTLLMEGWF